MTSKPIIGHEKILEDLRQDQATGNVGHAYLFSGARHLGKMTVARWWSDLLITEGLGEEEAARTLKEAGRLMHPDLLVLDQLWIEGVCEEWDVIAKTSNVSQEERMKNGAKTDTISVDDIRALQDRLVETGAGRHRCCIIRSIERLQAEGANAFLKILEEPPPGLTFLLTTQSLSSLPPTVISRCRVLPFQRTTDGELLPLLKDLPEDDRQFILHLAQGAPGIAITLRNDPEALREHRLVHTRAISFWKTNSLKERLTLLAPLEKRGDQAEDFLLHLALALREQGIPETEHATAFRDLVKGLKTNAHRLLLAEEFALALAKEKNP